MKYTIKLKQTNSGITAWCPELPGCWSQGCNEKQARENIYDAIETYIGTRNQLIKDQINLNK